MTLDATLKVSCVIVCFVFMGFQDTLGMTLCLKESFNVKFKGSPLLLEVEE